VKGALRAQQRAQLRAAIPPDHLWHRTTAGKEPKHRGIPRALQRALSQLRAGRSPLTGAGLYRFNSKSAELHVPATGDHGMTLDSNGYVTAVAAKSAAAKAKIGKGWRLEKVAGTAMSTGAQCDAALRAACPKVAKLHFNRHGSPECQGCGEKVDDTEHLITRCPAYALARNDCFGTPDPPLTVLQAEPWQVIAYLRQIYRLTAAQRNVMDAAEAVAIAADAGKAEDIAARSVDYGTVSYRAALQAATEETETVQQAAADAAPVLRAAELATEQARKDRDARRTAATEATVLRTSSEGEWDPPADLPRYAYRALRADEDVSAGLRPADPTARASPHAHVVAEATRTQYISLTARPAVALYYARCCGALQQRVVRIQLSKLDPRRLVDVRTEAASNEAGLGPAAKCYTAGDYELLYTGTIPPAAITQPLPNMARCEMLAVSWGSPPPRRPSVDAKRVFLAELPVATWQELKQWEQPPAPVMRFAAAHAAQAPAAAHAAKGLQVAQVDAAAAKLAIATEHGGTPPAAASADAVAANATVTALTTTTLSSSSTSTPTPTRASPATPRTASRPPVVVRPP
jgi:hypothetical protein